MVLSSYLIGRGSRKLRASFMEPPKRNTSGYWGGGDQQTIEIPVETLQRTRPEIKKGWGTGILRRRSIVQRTKHGSAPMCISIKIQIMAMVFSYQGCASVEWVNLPQKVEPPKEPTVMSEFWAQRLESTDPNEEGVRVYIFKDPATNRKTDAVAACGDGSAEERQVGDSTELKIVQTTRGKLTSFSVACKKPPETG